MVFVARYFESSIMPEWLKLDDSTHWKNDIYKYFLTTIYLNVWVCFGQLRLFPGLTVVRWQFMIGPEWSHDLNTGLWLVLRTHCGQMAVFTEYKVCIATNVSHPPSWLSNNFKDLGYIAALNKDLRKVCLYELEST